MNNDGAAHTSTSGTPANGPSGHWDSSLIMMGGSFHHTFNESGTYEYYCAVHPWTLGKVVVGGDSTIKTGSSGDTTPPVVWLAYPENPTITTTNSTGVQVPTIPSYNTLRAFTTYLTDSNQICFEVSATDNMHSIVDFNVQQNYWSSLSPVCTPGPYAVFPAYGPGVHTGESDDQ